MTKADVIPALVEKQREQITILKNALSDSEEGACGDETKSEGKYDTRAIEASYLAEAQREQLAIAEKNLALLERFEPEDFNFNAEIAPGALVECDSDDGICFFLLAPVGGGLVIDFLGCELTVVTPDSRLYQELLSQKIGARLESPALMITGLE